MKEFKNIFNTFQQLEKVISWAIEPVVHFIVPRQMSEDLSCLVVECRTSGQWHTSSYFKEWNADERSKAYENMSEILKKNNIPFAAWSIFKDDIEKLKSNLKTWSQIKLSRVPLLSDIETSQKIISLTNKKANSELTIINEKLKESKNIFNTFQQLEKVISWAIEPVVHFIVPRQMSEDLSCLVVECRITGQWYISSYFKEWDEDERSKAYENMSEILKKNNISSAAWSIFKDDIEKLKSGLKTWPQIKLSGVPLLADIETSQKIISLTNKEANSELTTIKAIKKSNQTLSF